MKKEYLEERKFLPTCKAEQVAQHIAFDLQVKWTVTIAIKKDIEIKTWNKKTFQYKEIKKKLWKLQFYK